MRGLELGEPVNVDTRKMKPGICMAVGRDLDLGRSWEKRNEVFCGRDGPREPGKAEILSLEKLQEESQSGVRRGM